MRKTYEKCLDCGKPKNTRMQRYSPRCSSCARAKQQAERNKQYFTCIDCGKPKTTYHQQRSPRCSACAGKHKREYGYDYIVCVDCGKPKEGTSRIYPRCVECSEKRKQKHDFFDTCQKCGKPKKHTHNQMCVSCANAENAKHRTRTIKAEASPKKKRQADKKQRPEPKTIKAPNKHRYEVIYSICQQCGKEKASTNRPLCHRCSTVVGGRKRAFRTVYDHCQKCGKPKPKNDRELCLACAGVKRMTEMYPNTDREYPYGWSENFREAIRDRDHHRCVLCGKSERDNRRKLDCHHIDYNKQNISPDNLLSLCMVCHQKTNWHRSYWQTFFAMQKRQHLQDWQRKVVVTSVGWSPICQ